LQVERQSDGDRQTAQISLTVSVSPNNKLGSKAFEAGCAIREISHVERQSDGDRQTAQIGLTVSV